MLFPIFIVIRPYNNSVTAIFAVILSLGQKDVFSEDGSVIAYSVQ